MAIFFTSDNHFGHVNIVSYCNRPFVTEDGHPDVKAMDKAMVQRWNAVVLPYDTVYHLGDFSMAKNVGAIHEYRKKLNGRIVLVRGNHDQSVQKMLQAGFEEVHDRLEKVIEGLRIYMSHIPFPCPSTYAPALTRPPPPEYDVWLCGHVHEKWRRQGKTINVGVDKWEFFPRRLDELLAIP